MLTKEVLNQQEVLTTLSEEQVAAITTLSKNDEDIVIGERIGRLHGDYDRDVLMVSGVVKNQGEKTYDYVKRVIGGLKTKAESAGTYETKLAEVQSEVETYKQKLADGKGSEVVAQQLTDAKARMTQMEKQHQAEKESLLSEKNKAIEDAKNFRINAEFDRELSKMKFKSAYPETVQKMLIDKAKEQILTELKPEFGDTGLVFRDASGVIANNPQNALNPYTAGELLKAKLNDALEAEHRQNGTGTSAQNDRAVFDLGGATSQVAADEQICDYLMKKGLLRGTREFADEQTKIRKENGVEKLPLR